MTHQTALMTEDLHPSQKSLLSLVQLFIFIGSSRCVSWGWLSYLLAFLWLNWEIGLWLCAITSDNVKWVGGALIVGDYPLKSPKFADDADGCWSPKTLKRAAKHTSGQTHTANNTEHTCGSRCIAGIDTYNY